MVQENEEKLTELFVTAKNSPKIRNSPKCPSGEEQINTLYSNG